MIIVNLAGGLGNQMFMYAFGRAQAEKYGDELFFSTYSFSKDTLGRKYRLDKLNIPSNIKFVCHYPFRYFLFIIKRLWFEFFIRIRKEDRLDVRVTKKYAPKGYFFSYSGEYIEPYYAYKLINYYNNTFQCEKYFLNIREKIKEELRPKDASDKCKKYAERLLGLNSVCVHIRRTDFCVNPTLNVCGKQYYLDAIEKMKGMVQNPVFYIFSEDMDWVKRNFNSKEFNLVDIGNSEIEDLYMMCRCAHFIIPNSSFSWWAQYLTIHTGKKVVIAPEYWYPHKTGTSDNHYNTSAALYMDDWTLIKPTPWRDEDI